MTLQELRPPARAAARAGVALVLLTLVWGVAFLTQLTPFFPTIVAGGLLTGLAGLWVRAGEPEPPAAGAAPRGFPPFAMTGRHAALAAAVAVAHLGVGHLLLRLGATLVPALTETAATVYDRAGGPPLWLAVLLGGFVTAPLEEVFWRGGFQPLAIAFVHRRLPATHRVPGGAVVLTALVYALFHAATGQLALVAAALLGGLVWGWLLERTGSLGAVMLAHGLWTALMLLFPPV